MGSFLSSQNENFESFRPVNQQIVYDYNTTQLYRRQNDDYRREVDTLIKENRILKVQNQSLRKQQHTLNSKVEKLVEDQNKSLKREQVKTSISTDHIKKIC